MVETYGLDNGYAQTKLWGRNTHFVFRSRIEPTEEDHAAGNVLEYEGKRYVIGRGTEDIEQDKTGRLVHRICTLAALARAADERQERIEARLVIGLPMAHYRNREARESFKEYIAGQDEHSKHTGQKENHLRYNGQPRSIIVKDAAVFPQGAAALYAENPLAYKGRLAAVIDIGGLTVNGCVFEDLNPVQESAVTINAGQLILQNKIKSTLNEKLFLNVQDYEVPYLIRRDEYQPIIQPVIDDHLAGIVAELRKKNWSLETLRIAGVGGGVLAAGYDTLKRHFPSLTVTPDPVYANAKGLYRIGVSLWE